MAPGDQNIQHYVDSFQRGEEKGFSYFFNALYPSLLYYAFRIVKDKSPAEDIVEESFIKIWERADNFKEAGKIKSWLYATVRNGCFDYLRKAKKTKENDDALAGLLKDTMDSNRLQDMILAEVVREIYAALNSLPPRCKQVFTHLFIEGKTLNETAAAMNTSINTVKNQRARGLKLLREKTNSKLTGFSFILTCA